MCKEHLTEPRGLPAPQTSPLLTELLVSLQALEDLKLPLPCRGAEGTL